MGLGEEVVAGRGDFGPVEVVQVIAQNHAEGDRLLHGSTPENSQRPNRPPVRRVGIARQVLEVQHWPLERSNRRKLRSHFVWAPRQSI